ncbi:MAG TPA: GNAT family N-acetyltransferase [Kofleriaceae bacterium]|jgi:RimJ/RimL family protein N-acetyltransferase
MKLSPIVPAHAPLVFSALCDPSLYRFTDDAPPVSIEALASRFARWQTDAPPGEVWLNWLILDDGAPAGHLQATLYPSESRAVIAYLVFRDHQRRGLATAAATWLLADLAVRGIALAEATIEIANTPSIRLVDRLGFTRISLDGSEARYAKRL